MDNQFCKKCLTDLYMTPDNLWGFCDVCKEYRSGDPLYYRCQDVTENIRSRIEEIEKNKNSSFDLNRVNNSFC
jgi:hypothetical protein